MTIFDIELEGSCNWLSSFDYLMNNCWIKFSSDYYITVCTKSSLYIVKALKKPNSTVIFLQFTPRLRSEIDNDFEREVVASVVEEIVCATVNGELAVSNNRTRERNKKASTEIGEREELER